MNEAFIKNKLQKNFLQNLMVMVLYYILGSLGLFIAVPPGNISPVWLPAGVALFFMIFYGKKILPGIIVGSFVINLQFYILKNNWVNLTQAILLSFLIAVGSTLQAILGEMLFNKQKFSNKSLGTIKDLLSFSYIVSPITALVSATWATLILYLFNDVQNHQIVSSWLVWYIGDYSGIVVFCTIALIGRIQFSASNSSNTSLTLKSFMVLIILILFTLALSWKVVSQVEIAKVRIGISQWGDNLEYAKNIAAFKATLTKEGYVEGENIEYFIETPNANKEAVKNIVEKFLNKNVNLLFIQTTPATLEAKKITQSTPIVFSIVTYPVETNVIQSLDNSGNNVVGTRNYIPMQRQFNVFKQIFKNPKRIGFVHRKNEPNSTFQLTELQEIARNNQFEVIEIAPENINELPQLLENNKNNIDSVFSACDTLIQSGAEDIVIEFVKKYNLPDFACLTSGIKKGSLIGNVANFTTIGSKAGELAAKILNGANPSSLSTYSPDEDTIIINLQRAQDLNINVELSVLENASEIIR